MSGSEIDNSIKVNDISISNYLSAPTPVLSEFLKQENSQLNSEIIKFNKKAIAEFSDFVKRSDFKDKYEILENAKWDLDADSVWNSLNEDEASRLFNIRELMQNADVSVNDDDFQIKIMRAFHDQIAHNERQELLRYIKAILQVSKHNKRKTNPIQDDINLVRKEIRELEIFARPIKSLVEQLKDTDAQFDKLLGKSAGLLSAIKSPTSNLKAKILKRETPQQELTRLLQQLAELHAIIALVNSPGARAALQLESVVRAEVNILSMLQNELSPNAKSMLNAAAVIATDTINTIANSPRIAAGSLAEALKSGKRALRSANPGTKTPDSTNSSDSIKTILTSSMSNRRLVIDTEQDYDEIEPDLPDVLQSQSSNSTSSNPPSPMPTIDQLKIDSISEELRKKRIADLNAQLSTDAKLVVGEELINQYFAKTSADREVILQQHEAAFQAAVEKQQAKLAKSKKSHGLIRKQTQLFTADSKQAAGSDEQSQTRKEEVQLRNQMQQVLRDINQGAGAVQNYTVSVMLLLPTESNTLEVQLDVLKEVEQKSWDPFMEFDSDEDNDGQPTIEQSAEMVKKATNLLGAFNVVNSTAAEHKIKSSKIDSLRNAAWNAIQLVINGLKRLIDLISKLFTRKKYDTAVVNELQAATNSLSNPKSQI